MSRMANPELQLLELLKRADEPADTDRERVRRKIALELATGAAVATTLVASQKGSWLLGSGKLVAWLKGATVIASLSAVAAGAAYYVRPSALPLVESTSERPARPAQPVVSRLNAVAPVAPPALSAASTVASPEANQTSKSTGLVASARPTARAASGDLEAETRLISQAQRALTSGQPNEALRVLDEHQRKFPAGALSAERVGVRTVALCQAGRTSEGRAAARSYLRKVPNSVLSKRIRVACQLSDE